MKNGLKATIGQFVKFNIVGILNTGVDFGLFYLLTDLFGVNEHAAKIISYTAGIVNSYVWNTMWTFRKEKKRTLREMALFLLVNLVSLGVNEGVFALCSGPLGIDVNLVNLILASGGAALVNFAGNKLIVFNRPNSEPGIGEAAGEAEAEEEKPE